MRVITTKNREVFDAQNGVRSWNVGTNGYSRRRVPYVGTRQKHYFNVIFSRRVRKNVRKQEAIPNDSQPALEIGMWFLTASMGNQNKLEH